MALDPGIAAFQRLPVFLEPERGLSLPDRHLKSAFGGFGEVDPETARGIQRGGVERQVGALTWEFGGMVHVYCLCASSN